MEANCGQCRPHTDRIYFTRGHFNPTQAHVCGLIFSYLAGIKYSPVGFWHTCWPSMPYTDIYFVFAHEAPWLLSFEI